MISLIQVFSSSVLLKQEKNRNKRSQLKTINKEYWKVAFPAAIGSFTKLNVTFGFNYGRNVRV